MKVLFYGAGNGIKSEPKIPSNNFHIINNLLFIIKSTEYNVFELKMQMINFS